jgi:hypothetical protein
MNFMKFTGPARRIALVALAAAMMAGHSVAETINHHEDHAPQIWFTPLSWVVSKVTKRIDYSAHDFPNILRADAPWGHAASRVRVLGMPGNVVWSYPDRAALVRFFHDHDFKAAFAFGMLFDDGLCNKRIEGISREHDFAHEAVNIARLWKQAGGELDYIIMDAPLGYGHFLEPSCTHTIDDVARRAAATLAGIRAYFPDVRVVDAEGPGSLPNGEWLAMMDEWLTAFERHAGRRIDAVALDLHWVDLRAGNSWQDTSRRSAGFFRERGVRTGLIVNDDQLGPGVTDANFLDANRRHITDVANGGGLGLNFLLINSWMGHPSYNLPEGDPLAYSSLVNFAHETLHRRE